MWNISISASDRESLRPSQLRFRSAFVPLTSEWFRYILVATAAAAVADVPLVQMKLSGIRIRVSGRRTFMKFFSYGKLPFGVAACPLARMCMKYCPNSELIKKWSELKNGSERKWNDDVNSTIVCCEINANDCVGGQPCASHTYTHSLTHSHTRRIDWMPLWFCFRKSQRSPSAAWHITSKHTHTHTLLPLLAGSWRRARSAELKNGFMCAENECHKQTLNSDRCNRPTDRYATYTTAAAASSFAFAFGRRKLFVCFAWK